AGELGEQRLCAGEYLTFDERGRARVDHVLAGGTGVPAQIGGTHGLVECIRDRRHWRREGRDLRGGGGGAGGGESRGARWARGWVAGCGVADWNGDWRSISPAPRGDSPPPCGERLGAGGLREAAVEEFRDLRAALPPVTSTAFALDATTSPTRGEECLDHT